MSVTTIVILCEDVTVGVVVLVLELVAVEVAQTVTEAVADTVEGNVERTVVVGEAIFVTDEFDDADDVAESDEEAVVVMVDTRVTVERAETVAVKRSEAEADEELVLETEAVAGAEAVIVIGEDNVTDGKPDRVKRAEDVGDMETVSVFIDETEPILDSVEEVVSLDVRDVRGVTDARGDTDSVPVDVNVADIIPLAEMEIIPVSEIKLDGDSVEVDENEIVPLVQALNEDEPVNAADAVAVVVDVVDGEEVAPPVAVPAMLTLGVDVVIVVTVAVEVVEPVVEDVAADDTEMLVDAEGDIDAIPVDVVDCDVMTVVDAVPLAVVVPVDEGVPVPEMEKVLGAVATAVREM